MRRANRAFFSRDVLEVAPALLGCVLQRTDAQATIALRITEVEAYAGERDPGAHSYRGKTNRNKTLFGPPGHLYCYFTYGLHHAINVVVGQLGQPYGCLIRAGEVIEGADVARRRREQKPRKVPLPEHGLARGPGCVAQSFGVDLTNDGDALFAGEWRFFVPRGDVVVPHEVGPRVGVSGPGGDPSTYPWRYWLAGASSVSTYKPGRT
jgi:DNA-3-methyladenine glycosylase